MATLIKTAVTAEIWVETTEILTLSPIEVDEKSDPITQSTMMTSDESPSTPMEVYADHRKIMVLTEIEETLATNRTTSTRNLRP